MIDADQEFYDDIEMGTCGKANGCFIPLGNLDWKVQDKIEQKFKANTREAAKAVEKLGN